MPAEYSISQILQLLDRSLNKLEKDERNLAITQIYDSLGKYVSGQDTASPARRGETSLEDGLLQPDTPPPHAIGPDEQLGNGSVQKTSVVYNAPSAPATTRSGKRKRSVSPAQDGHSPLEPNTQDLPPSKRSRLSTPICLSNTTVSHHAEDGTTSPAKRGRPRNAPVDTIGRMVTLPSKGADERARSNTLLKIQAQRKILAPTAATSAKQLLTIAIKAAANNSASPRQCELVAEVIAFIFSTEALAALSQHSREYHVEFLGNVAYEGEQTCSPVEVVTRRDLSEEHLATEYTDFLRRYREDNRRGHQQKKLNMERMLSYMELHNAWDRLLDCMSAKDEKADRLKERANLYRHLIYTDDKSHGLAADGTVNAIIDVYGTELPRDDYQTIRGELTRKLKLGAGLAAVANIGWGALMSLQTFGWTSRMEHLGEDHFRVAVTALLRYDGNIANIFQRFDDSVVNPIFGGAAICPDFKFMAYDENNIHTSATRHTFAALMDRISAGGLAAAGQSRLGAATSKAGL